MNLGQLASGTYSWTTIAKFQGKTLFKSGEFVVEDVAIESLDTRANFSVLNQLTTQSDGSFETLNNYSKLIDQIAARKDITSVRYSDSGFTSLIDWVWIFVLLILLFGTEWFLRRFWGTY